MATDSFKFWDSYWHALCRVSDEQAGALVKALCAYVFDGEEPDYSDEPLMGMVFDVMAGQAEQSRDLSRQARENGAKGRGKSHAKGSQKGGFGGGKAPSKRKEKKGEEATFADGASLPPNGGARAADDYSDWKATDEEMEAMRAMLREDGAE